ncbi:SprB repeat-containing protein [Flavobacterium sp. UGB4466]|uniref:SprB repeat-containing protein n=1 Tax=Flavobacterium sp. UGB4466 TaxID=2730889 RepID=UPI00192BE0C4|nr:SprB repeat-containing protein [Flavobacterium sp. UGB4466]
MTKKLPLILFFLGSLFAYGQTDYGILIKSKITSPSVWPSNDYSGLHQITAGMNSCSIDFLEDNYKNDLYCFFYVTGNPTKIDFMEVLGGSPTCGQITRTIPYNKDTFKGWFFSGCLANAEIMPLHITRPDSNPKCKEDPITLNNGWNWQYQFDSEGWKNLPVQFQEQPSITFKIKDLPGYNSQANVHFIAGYEKYGQYTNTVTYTIIGCSPELAEKKPTANSVKCNNTATGSVTLKFESPLKKDDQFLFNLYRVNPVAPDTGFIKSIKASEKETENKTYTWEGIAAGTYTIKYQAQSKFDNGQIVGSSAIVTDSFTIENKDQLTFRTTAIQPKCSGDPGSIEISVTGGTSPYFYILDNGIKTPLTKNPDTINGVTDGAHTVTVLDSHGCIEN